MKAKIDAAMPEAMKMSKAVETPSPKKPPKPTETLESNEEAEANEDAKNAVKTLDEMNKTWKAFVHAPRTPTSRKKEQGERSKRRGRAASEPGGN